MSSEIESRNYISTADEFLCYGASDMKRVWFCTIVGGSSCNFASRDVIPRLDFRTQTSLHVPWSDHVRRPRSRPSRVCLPLFLLRTRRGDAAREVRHRRGSRAKPPAQAVGLALERPSKPSLPRTSQRDADLQRDQPVRRQKLALSDPFVDGARCAGP